MNKLKIFTDKRYLRSLGHNYISMLAPFWGDCDPSYKNIDYGRFQEYTKIGSQFIELVTIEESDAVVLPNEWPAGGKYIEANAIIDMANKYSKPILIFFNNDSSEDINIGNSIIFRTSFYASTRKNNEYAMPGWSKDFVKEYLNGEIQIRTKKSIPAVSYTGYVDYYNIRTFMKYLIRKNILGGETNPGRYLRGETIRLIKESKEIRPSFIIRDSRIKGYSSETLRKEYVRNIVDSDYSLVIRGKGNFSYRLYEVLSCGRIPLFINTDCVLPFDHMIDWKKYMIWVESCDLPSIGRMVSDYHESITEKQFKDMQKECRELYE